MGNSNTQPEVQEKSPKGKINPCFNQIKNQFYKFK